MRKIREVEPDKEVIQTGDRSDDEEEHLGMQLEGFEIAHDRSININRRKRHARVWQIVDQGPQLVQPSRMYKNIKCPEGATRDILGSHKKGSFTKEATQVLWSQSCEA